MASSTGYQSRLDLASQPTAVHWARVHTEDILRSWSVPESLVENAVLIVSELASNAVRHAGALEGTGDDSPEVPRFTVNLWTSDRRLIIAVYDQDRRPPIRREASLESETGRGLTLVDALSERWGYSYPSHTSGKLVYALLPMSEPDETRAELHDLRLEGRSSNKAGAPSAVSA
jgi:serine/threonine-protein kinase RsbW